MSVTVTTEKGHVKGSSERLAHLPVPVFAIVMGMAGTAIVYLRAGALLWSNLVPGIVLAAVTAVLFVVLLIAYGMKALRYPDRVRQEFESPVKLHFFPTITISLILLSIAFLHVLHTVSLVLWVVGSAAHLLLTLKTLSIWIQKEHFEINHIEPTWFIPVVGTILVPVAGVELAPADVSWFFFSIGLVLWLVLFTIFFYRIIFHHPLASRRLPTFFIVMAPPAVAFISYLRLTGEVDSFARILYYFSLFLFLLLVYQWRMFKSARFYISWWAYSFPVAALTIATMLMMSGTGAAWLEALAWAFIGLLTVLVAVLLVLTARAAKRHEICVEE